MKIELNPPYVIDERITACDSPPPDDWRCICETDPTLDPDAFDPADRLAGIVAYAHPKTAPALASMMTACHNLDLPVNVSPGALAEIVTAARALLTRAIAGLDQSATHDGLRNGQVIARMRAALENVAPPEPKPYGYAVKTAEGYVANQGNQWWHESEPVGWALFGTREGAESIAGLRGGEVVPVFKR